MGMLSKVLAGRPPAAESVAPEKITRMVASGTAKDERYGDFGTKPAVGGSEDLERVLELPRRPIPDDTELERIRVLMTARLNNGRVAGDGCRCTHLNTVAVANGLSPCITELRPIQAWYLYEAEQVGGADGMIAVGGGKTGIDALTAMVVPNCQRAVLLIPPGLKEQFLADFELWGQHFKVPNLGGGRGPFVPGRPVLEVLKYSELSAPGFATWLKTREIDAIIADEAHSLKDRKAVRVDRFLKYFIGKPETRFFWHTGSATSKGIEDYSHLSALALREGSPVPLDPRVVTEWGEALNPTRPGQAKAPAGKLRQFCENDKEPVEHGFARRLLETRGVVATSEGSLTGVDLVFSTRTPPPMPPVVADALRIVRNRQIRPDGEELKDALEVAAVARQVAAGFYLYWSYPRGEPVELIEEWFRRRQAWNREVRGRLEHRRTEMDSEGLLKAAAKRFEEGYKGPKPVWESFSWAAWNEIEDQVQPITRVKWIDPWLAADAAKWALETEAAGRPGIVWTLNSAMGRKVAELCGRTYYGQGPDAARAIRQETGKVSIVASIPAHHKGRNLQMFSANHVVQIPSSAEVWEQLCGRTHRSLQMSKNVLVSVYQHVPEFVESFEMAIGRARYVKQTTRADQKLLASRPIQG